MNFINFFANFGRVYTISISKIAVKSHKLCVKTSFWYIPEIIAHIFNQQEGRGCQRFRYITEGGCILLTLRTVTRGGGRAKFSPKTTLRKLWMIPKFIDVYLQCWSEGSDWNDIFHKQQSLWRWKDSYSLPFSIFINL